MLRSSLLSNLYCGGCSVVAISNIDRGDSAKKTMYSPDLFFLIYDPYTMCDLVIGSKSYTGACAFSILP